MHTCFLKKKISVIQTLSRERVRIVSPPYRYSNLIWFISIPVSFLNINVTIVFGRVGYTILGQGFKVRLLMFSLMNIWFTRDFGLFREHFVSYAIFWWYELLFIHKLEMYGFGLVVLWVILIFWKFWLILSLIPVLQVV